MPQCFTRDFVEKFSQEVKDSLQAIADKHDVRLTLKGFKWSSTKVEMSIDGIIEDALTAISQDEQVQFNIYCGTIGLSKDYYGRTFQWNLNGRRMTTMKIVAVEPRSHKYPIICEDQRTKNRYKFNKSTIMANVGVLNG